MGVNACTLTVTVVDEEAWVSSALSSSGMTWQWEKNHQTTGTSSAAKASLTCSSAGVMATDGRRQATGRHER
jgi:hypothetical protein